MARKNLVAQACADKQELFARLRDFICGRNGTYDYSTAGIGWTLHDSSYAVDEDNSQVNDWFVIKSVGEGGDEDLYFHVKWVASYIIISGYQYWDSTLHTGVHRYNSSNNFSVLDAGSNFEIYIYGNLDSIVAFEIEGHATYNYFVYFGKLVDGLYDDTVATSSSSVSSGSDVSITVDSAPAAWVVGTKLFIRDDAELEMITIKTISGNVLTADLSASFDAGCKLQGDLLYCCNSGYNSPSIAMIVTHTTTASATASVVPKSGIVDACDPDQLNSLTVIDPVTFYTTNNGWFGRLEGLYHISLVGLTEGDTMTDADGNSYRYFPVYSGYYFVMLEV